MHKKDWQEAFYRLLRWLLKTGLARWFRITIEGDYQQTANTVIIANHVSTIDALLLAAFLPERLTFTLEPQHSKKLLVKALSLFAEVLILDPSETSANQILIKAILSGKVCVLFLDASKSEKTCYDQAALILQESGARVRPIRIEGAQHSIFSLTKDKFVIRLFPKITLHLRGILSLQSPQDVIEDGKEYLSMKLFLLLSEMSYANFAKDKALFAVMLEGARRAGKLTTFVEDSNRLPLTSRQFVTRCFILGRQFKAETETGEIVGLMLPTCIAAMVSFFALQAYRRVPAMLNFSSGFYNLYSACQTAGIRRIYTSRQFIQTAKLEVLLEELSTMGLELRFLEDFAAKINLTHKIAGLLKGFLPSLTYRVLGKVVEPNQTAVVLFTSGSEGVPKGVALSHTNILANCYQMISRVDFSPQDIFFNALPIFHCFGLTAGSIVPFLTGNRCFLYPSPLHYKIIPGLVYETKATIFFATDTFLKGYARAAGSQDFSSLRYIFAGAEKVKTETTQYWLETFGAQIYEGYGATEASPVISLNCPLASKLGTVGFILPAIEYRVEPVEGIVEGGRLHIRGPNIMSGYLSADHHPSRIDKPEAGWHDTGDIVSVAEDGFLTIIGRAKRFAKLGGEMVPLSVVESIASALWPEQLHAALYRKCPRKGEQIVLLSETSEANKKAFIQHIRTHGQSELLVPQIIFSSIKIPVLSSGKIDYLTLERNLAELFPDS